MGLWVKLINHYTAQNEALTRQIKLYWETKTLVDTLPIWLTSNTDKF